MKLAPWVLLVRRAKPAPWGYKGQWDQRAHKEHKVKLARWVPLVRPVSKDHKAKLALRVLLVPPVQPVNKVRRAKLARWVLLVPSVRPVSKDPKAKLARWVPPVRKASRALQAPWDCKAPWGQRAQMALLA